MERTEIDKILKELETTKDKNIVIIDYGNVQKWEDSLGWKIGIRELGGLVKHLAVGKKFLRRFYYGSDFGPSDKSGILVPWSKMILDKANISGFEVVTKRVKYIHSDHPTGFDKKCDLDVEMTIDLIKESSNYEMIVLFSGDGDLACTLKYLADTYKKQAVVFTARGHLGKELVDLKDSGVIKHILYADDFEYRLNMNRFRP